MQVYLTGQSQSALTVMGLLAKMLRRLAMKTLLTLVQAQYRKSGCVFFSSEPVAARSDCC